MAIGGCEVSYCFLDKMKNMEENTSMSDAPFTLDLTDAEEVRNAIIASEILTRKQ